jgi:hypothetical protein
LTNNRFKIQTIDVIFIKQSPMNRYRFANSFRVTGNDSTIASSGAIQGLPLVGVECSYLDLADWSNPLVKAGFLSVIELSLQIVGFHTRARFRAMSLKKTSLFAGSVFPFQAEPHSF